MRIPTCRAVSGLALAALLPVPLADAGCRTMGAAGDLAGR
jgi:hypothetical protein